MTDKELFKLALDALELVNIEFVRNGAHHAKKDRHGLDEDCPVTMRYRKAITALEERLADHPMREVQRLGQEIEQEPVMWSDYESNGIHHKPVAWRTYIGRGYYIIDPTFEDAQKNWPDKQHQPLYTTPPQRKPLTVEQIWEIKLKSHQKFMTKVWVEETDIKSGYYKDVERHTDSPVSFARAIEAAHGIKENT